MCAMVGASESFRRRPIDAMLFPPRYAHKGPSAWAVCTASGFMCDPNAHHWVLFLCQVT